MNHNMADDALSAEAAEALQARLPSDMDVSAQNPNSEENMSTDGDQDGLEMQEGHEETTLNDGFSPRRGHTHKRPEEPPKNDVGKMICRFQGTCAGLIFDRKCEWSKHMDKHERPYKCDAPGCEKLQGFTYSGGLLRHQREVHKMHGGTKEALFCPFGNCKRATGAGFTRKENRDEHIRRVHRRATEAVDGSNAAGKRDREAMEEADALLQDISHIDVIEAVEAVEPIITAPVSKRRRVTQATMISRSNGNSNGPSHGIGNAMNHALANAAIDPALESSDSDLKSSIKSLQEANHILVKQNESIRRDCLNLTERLNRLEELLGRNGVPESMLR